MRITSGFLFVSLMLCVHLANGQSKAVLKAKSYNEDGMPDKAVKSLEKYTESKTGAKDVQAWLELGRAYYLLAKTPEYDAHRDLLTEKSIKALQKATRKDKEMEFVADEVSLYFQVNELAMEIAEDLRKRQKYSKAIQMAKLIEEQTNFPGVQVLIAKIDLTKGDTGVAMDRLNKNAERITNEVGKDITPANEEKEGFDMLIGLYRGYDRADSVLEIASMRINAYGPDNRLSGDLNWALKRVLDVRAVDMSLVEDLESWKAYFTCDTLFQRLHTAVYIYMFREAAEADQQEASADYFSRYYVSKTATFKKEGLQCLERATIYDTLDGEMAVKFYRYQARLLRTKAALAALRLMAKGNLSYSNDTIHDWNGVMRKLHVSKDDWGYLLALNAALMDKELNEAEKKKQEDFIKNILAQPASAINREAQLMAAEIVTAQYNQHKALLPLAKSTLLAQLNKLLDERKSVAAFQLSKKHQALLSKEKSWNQLRLRIAETDYKVNYFGTRFNEKDSLNKGWLNGTDFSQCKGTGIPDSVQTLVAMRINYFRRWAGLSDDVYLGSERNSACQQAAMVLAQLPRPTHTLSKGMRCYSEAAAEATKLGAITLGQNVTLGITSIMADMGTQNQAVGNRRWLLYPGAGSMGHGSVKNVGVYWIMDEGLGVDSTQFSENPVCWPPQGYVPIIFNFSRWSFSVAGDVSKAEVIMRASGKEIALQALKPVAGYGLPTLVWEPSREELKGAKGAIEVEVKGVIVKGSKEPRIYKYAVQFFEPMP